MIDTRQWKIDPETTRVFHYGYPDNRIRIETLDWIVRRFPWGNVCNVGQPNYIVARNQTIAMALKLPPEVTDFIFIDRDIVPSEKSDPIFTIDADAVSCFNDVEDSSAWSVPDAFHQGLWRCKREVLAAITPPWLMRTYNEQGTKQLACDCHFLREKILAAGFSIAYGGFAGHDNEHTCFGARYCGL